MRNQFIGGYTGCHTGLPKGHDKSDRLISKEDFFLRQLFHLRSSPSNQINLTLDYFKIAMSKLDDRNLQIYFEANLFEPGLLCDLLDQESQLPKTKRNFLNRLDEFIKQGLNNFTTSEGAFSQTSIFFIRLSLYVNRYIAQYKPELAEGRLQIDHRRLNAAITTDRKS